MELRIPEQVRQALSKLRACGYEAYIVGGCVRDLLLGREPDDYDITTSALPFETMRCFAGYHIIETGVKHGTVTAVIDGMPLEITTYRIDGQYSDNRRPDSVTFTRSLREDLARRDFTINAMAYSPSNGLQDYFGGQQDLKDQMIRCVGDPQTRFEEDALRILRAVRFSSVLGFGMEPATAAALLTRRGLLVHIARERVQVELNKLLLGRDVGRVLREYTEVLCEVISEIIPCIGFEQHSRYHLYDVWEHTVHTVERSPERLTVRLAMLLHDLAKPLTFSIEGGTGHFYSHQQKSADLAQEILKRLRYSGEITRRVVNLIRYHSVEFHGSAKAIKRWLGKLGEEELRELLLVQRSDLLGKDPSFWYELEELDENEQRINEIIAQNQCFTVAQLAVNGNDLREVGCTQGRLIGQLLEYLLDLVIDEECPNNREALLARANQYLVNRKQADE